MLSKIEISNFKAITKKLTLEGLTNVNYLVGPNGCGKSSVLEFLSFINTRMSKAQISSIFGDFTNIFRDNHKAKIVLDLKSAKYI